MTKNGNYLIHREDHMSTGRNIYKFGYIYAETMDKRMRTYTKGSEIILFARCYKSKEAEIEIKKIFKAKYIHREEFGAEYFEGDYKDMSKVVLYVTQNIDDILHQNEIDK